MAWLRIRLTEQQRVVNEERSVHPNPRIREKMLVLWLLHNAVTRQNAAKIVGVSRATVQQYVAAFREGGLDGLRQWNPNRPVSEMAAYWELIRGESFEKQPLRTVTEACERIFQLTGLRLGPSQVREFLKLHFPRKPIGEQAPADEISPPHLRGRKLSQPGSVR